MIVRELGKGEWEAVSHIFYEEFGEALPHPGTSRIVVVEEGGQIVGMLAARLMLHVEPLWVKASHRRHFLIPYLVNKLISIIPDINYAFSTTTNPKIGCLLERLGFRKQPYTTYRWVRGEEDGKSLRATG